MDKNLWQGVPGVCRQPPCSDPWCETSSHQDSQSCAELNAAQVGVCSTMFHSEYVTVPLSSHQNKVSPYN